MNTLTLTPWPGTRPGAAALNPMTLPIGAVHVLRRQAGARLEVASGRVWLTVPGDPDDHFVAGGQSMSLHNDGPIVIQSDGNGPAVLRVVPAPSVAAEQTLTISTRRMP